MECRHAGQDNSATHATSEEVVFVDARYPALGDWNNVKLLPTTSTVGWAIAADFVFTATATNESTHSTPLRVGGITHLPSMQVHLCNIEDHSVDVSGLGLPEEEYSDHRVGACWM